ncbi:MAG: type II toxin-antitoxin system Phd/YefM family antitoxin [Lacisediminihabitans sp.]
MATTISQRELRNDNAEIMRRVEAGERFTVIRHGKPIASVIPLEELPSETRRLTGAEIQELWRKLPRRHRCLVGGGPGGATRRR